ncbi:MAG: 4Fe-4S binding protein [Pseudomonadota bacterium]
MSVRQIIEIDEEKCTGCGQCIPACAEGALELVDGKAKLVGEILCDGIGACLGDCPEGALTLVERESEEFDEAAVEQRLGQLGKGKQPASCPSAKAMIFAAQAGPRAAGGASALAHWPIKLRLMGPQAPFLKGADLVLLADCGAVAYASLHADLLPGRAVALACPKFEDPDESIGRLAEILKAARPASLTVAYMEVPCCRGLVFVAEKALEKARVEVPVKLMKIARNGEILEDGGLAPAGPRPACACGS